MDIFNQLVMLYMDINNIYLSLLDMEKNKIRDNTFIKLIQLLKIKREEENRLFLELVDCEDYDDIKNIIKDTDNPMFLRMLDCMNIYDIINMKNTEEYDDEDDYDNDILNKFGKLYIIASRSIYLVYLSFLQEEIDNCNNKYISDELIGMKYYNALTKHSVEDCLISYNFYIPRDNYVDLYILSDILKIDDVAGDETILNIYYDRMEDVIGQLLAIKDNDLMDKNVLVEFYVGMCMLKACFSLLTEREYSSIRNKLFDKINELKNKDNTSVLACINKLINDRNIYRGRVKKLSLVPFNDD